MLRLIILSFEQLQQHGQGGQTSWLVFGTMRSRIAVMLVFIRGHNLDLVILVTREFERPMALRDEGEEKEGEDGNVSQDLARNG